MQIFNTKTGLAVLFTVILISTACTNAPSDKNNASKTIKVEGMTCEGCEQTIEMNLNELPGVTSAEASHVNKNVIVTYDSLQIKPFTIKEKIAEVGYETIP